MASTFEFPSPVLSVAVEAVRDLRGPDALTGLWSLFTRCKQSVKDGRRLENMSWRLWHRELTANSRASSHGELSFKHHSAVLEDRSQPADHATRHILPRHEAAEEMTINEASTTRRTPVVSASPKDSSSLTTRANFVGQMIVEMLADAGRWKAQPDSSPTSEDSNAAMSQTSSHADGVPSKLLPRVSATALDARDNASDGSISRPTHCDLPSSVLVCSDCQSASGSDQLAFLPTPADEDQASDFLNGRKLDGGQFAQSSARSKVLVEAPVVVMHGDLVPEHPTTPPAPLKVILVQPTPGPTPHPTPPTTPSLGLTTSRLAGFMHAGPATAESDKLKLLLPLPLPHPQPRAQPRLPINAVPHSSLDTSSHHVTDDDGRSRSSVSTETVCSHSTATTVLSELGSSTAGSAESLASYKNATCNGAVPTSDISSTTTTGRTDVDQVISTKSQSDMVREIRDEQTLSMVSTMTKSSTTGPTAAKNHSRRSSGSLAKSLLSPTTDIDGRKEDQVGALQSKLTSANHTRRTSSGSANGRVATKREVVRNAGRETRSASKNLSRSRSRESSGATNGVVGANGAMGGLAVGMALLMTSANATAAAGNNNTAMKKTSAGSKQRLALRRTASSRGAAVTMNGLMRQKSAEGKKEKRPTFNIGSHSDDGSGLGSKSAGSGSSVSAVDAVRDGRREREAVKEADAKKGKGKMKETPAQMRRANTEPVQHVAKPTQLPQPPLQRPPSLHQSQQPQRSQQVLPILPPPLSSQHPLPPPSAVIPPPQQRRTIVLATSESEYETETDSDRDSEERSRERDGVGDGAERKKREMVDNVDGGDSDEWASEDLSTSDVVVDLNRAAPLSNRGSRSTTHIQAAINGGKGPTRAQPSQRPLLNAGANHRQHLQQHVSRAQQQRQAQAARAQQVVEQAALEAQRQQDMFVKKQVPSTEQLHAMQRTRSVGLLTQLMNPDPQIFPPNHPYRRGFSSGEIRNGRPVGFGFTSMTADAKAGSDGPQMGVQMTHPVRPGMKTSKSAAAVPVASQVQAGSVTVGMAGTASGSGGGGPGTSNGYRPRGPPAGQELEDDSDSDSEEGDMDGILLSKSVAQEKLKALAQRRGIVANQNAKQGEAVNNASSSRQRPQQPSAPANPTPIPLGHPYNLPPPAAPSTPRTTRRLMLQTEMSESLRRNLLWERQVSKINIVGFRRSNSHAGISGGLRPLTTSNDNLVKVTVKGSGAGANGPGQGWNRDKQRRASGGAADVEAKEERRRRALVSDPSIADEFHYAGW